MTSRAAITSLRFGRTASRLSALGILGILLGFLYLTTVVPYLAVLDEKREDAAQKQALLIRYRKLADGLPALQARLDTLRSDGASLSGFLEEKSESLAAAMLQEHLKMAAAGEGAHLATVQVMPDREEGNARRVSLRVRMTADIGQLQRMLHHFESGRTALFLDNLDIRSVSGNSGGGSEEGGMLDVSFDLYGYMWREP